MNIAVKRGGAPKENDICSGTILSSDGEGLPCTIRTSLFASHGVYFESKTFFLQQKVILTTSLDDNYLYQYNYSKIILIKARGFLNELPEKQRETGWVLTEMARTYFDEHKYRDAVDVFKKIQSTEPYRLSGLEYYSTCLWRLEDSVALSGEFKLINRKIKIKIAIFKKWLKLFL